MARAPEAEDQLVENMKALGFTATDAKAYLALVKNSPATGYELATRSGVPRSAIYGVLKRLEALGLVNPIQDKPVRYVPLAPERLHHLLTTRFRRSLDELKGGLEHLAGQRKQAATWTVHGYNAMLEQAEGLIVNAKSSVYASMWGREAARLAPQLIDAQSRGVKVVLFSFNALDPSYGQVLSYEIAEAELESYWQHKVILVADQQRALVGGAEDMDNNRAVVTDEPALVEMAVSNLVLDITLLGQRKGLDVSEVVTHLTKMLAPVEELAHILES
ncbi:MAG: TrmB family transcriptional regulator [Polyangiaceae bacterium]